MSYHNDLTIELCEKTAFREKYWDLCNRYSKQILESVSDDVNKTFVESVLDTFGYRYRYFKGEKFYRLYLVKKDAYEAWFHFQLYAKDAGHGFLDPHIYIQEHKKYLAGSVMSELFHATSDISLEYVLRPAYDANIFQTLLEEVLELAWEYVRAFEPLKD